MRCSIPMTNVTRGGLKDPRLSNCQVACPEHPSAGTTWSDPSILEFLGGFVGVAQDQETLTLRPEIGWAVREAPATG
jgi:hypothetical protein